MTPKPLGGPYPGIRSPWYDRKCIEIGSDRGIAIELDIDPRGSVEQFFDSMMVRELVLTYCCDPYWEGDIHYDRDSGHFLELVPQKGGPLRLWCTLPEGKPEVGAYGFGGDVSAGSGATPSVFSGINFRTGEKVAEYRNARILPEDLAPVVTALGYLFCTKEGKPARLAWEVPGPGMTLGKRIADVLNYPNCYYRQSNVITEGGHTSEMPGWYNQTETLAMLMREYRAALSARQFINRSERAMNETADYKYGSSGQIEHGRAANKNDPSGARVNHGDHVIADGIAWKLCQLEGKMKPTKKEEEQQQNISSLAWRRMFHENAKQEEEAWL